MSIGGAIRRTLYWTNDYICGSKVRVHFNDLKKVLANYDKGSIIQKQHLNDLLRHAYLHSQFYIGYAEKELSEFPVVNKKILNENKQLIMVKPEDIPMQEGKEIHIQKTSGSTGTPLAVPQDTRKRNRRIAELKYYNEIIGFKSHERLGQCRIWTKWQSKSRWQSFRENITPINVSKMDEETLENIIKTVKRNRLISLRAYASWYDALVNYMETYPEKVKDLRTLKVCVSSSEALNEETRIKMREMTGVPIVECYANEENGMLAQQKKEGDNSYYLNNSGYVFEFLKLDSDEPAAYGELARIVITDLFNYAFPIIRYDTGDTAVFEKGNENSNGWPYISKLYGRRIDLVYDVNNQPVHPMNFARVLKNLPGIVQWQFIQKNRYEYVVRLCINENRVIDTQEIVAEIKKIVGEEAKIFVEIVDDIPVLASGKRKSVVCEWDIKNE